MKAAFKPNKSKDNNGVMEYFFRNGQALYLQRPKLVFIPLEVFQSDNISLTNILINIFPISVNNPHLIYVIPILAAALYLLQAMNSRRPIKSCVCSLGFVIDQIGGIKTTKYMLSLRWVFVLNVLPAAESWVRTGRSRAMGCLSISAKASMNWDEVGVCSNPDTFCAYCKTIFGIRVLILKLFLTP